MKIFTKGLATGLVLQLAMGPVFFYIINLALQKTFFDGLAGAIAVALVDYLYTALGAVGVGTLLENRKTKKVFGIVSSIVLAIFGIIITRSAISEGVATAVHLSTTNLFSSFTSVFFLTLSNPLTIVLYSGLLTAKGIEYNYSKRELFIFSFGIGFATFLFMGTSVVLFSLVKSAVPVLLIRILNLIVGCLLIGYGGMRLVMVVKNRETAKISRSIVTQS